MVVCSRSWVRRCIFNGISSAISLHEESSSGISCAASGYFVQYSTMNCRKKNLLFEPNTPKTGIAAEMFPSYLVAIQTFLVVFKLSRPVWSDHPYE